MRERLCRWALAAVSLVLCALFALGLLAYTQPMEAQVYDLSFVWEGETPPEGWVFSDKGWTVFIQEGTEKRELVPNGVGGYTGLDFPGQTIYFSRVLAEPLDAPTLQIAAADSAIAVFLDDVPLYADFDREKAAIGALRLPTLDAYRTEPVTISLPMDYRGRTLTIAQGTYIYEGVPAAEITAYPAAVTLLCGYAYESGLIAQSFRTAIPAALAYAAAALLLALMVWRAFHDRRDPGLLWAALALFFVMAREVGTAPFFYQYFGRTQFDFAGLARFFALAALLAFLSSRAGKRRWALWVLTGLYTLSVSIYLVIELRGLELTSDLLIFLAVSLPACSVGLLRPAGRAGAGRSLLAKRKQVLPPVLPHHAGWHPAVRGGRRAGAAAPLSQRSDAPLSALAGDGRSADRCRPLGGGGGLIRRSCPPDGGPGAGGAGAHGSCQL